MFCDLLSLYYALGGQIFQRGLFKAENWKSGSLKKNRQAFTMFYENRNSVKQVKHILLQYNN